MTSKDFATADLIDIKPETPSCETQMRMFGKKKCFSGKIRTLRVKNDNGLVKKTLNSPSEGEVLVVDGSGSMASALMGDMIASAGVKNGWAGVVIFGCIRDSVAIDEMDFGVKALGTNPKKSAKDGNGEVDVDISMGGVTFKPGHMLYADADGILVSETPIE